MYLIFCLQVVGIKGATVLSLHRPYDPSKGITIDDLHTIFLGIASNMLHFWFDNKHRTELFSLRSQVCSLGLCRGLQENYRLLSVTKFCYESKYQIPFQELPKRCLNLTNGRVNFICDYFFNPSLKKEMF